MSAPCDLESLVRECRPQLVRFLGRLVGPADAEDVTQLVLSKSLKAWAGFRGEASPRSWLFRIATNAAHDWMRSRVPVAPEPEAADDEDGASEDVEDASQERRLVREEMSRCVADLLRRLPESYQLVLALSDCEELSDREVAAVLGVTVGAAKIRLHRARTRMREELERHCTFYHDSENVLCCDKKEETSKAAYRSEQPVRHQHGSRDPAHLPPKANEELTMTTVDPLSTKEKQLIGIGAAIAAGCQPCTESFVAAARDSGACPRGVRFALESGLAGRERATKGMATFADEQFARPELDEAFRGPKALLDALIGVAAAIASNMASLVGPRVEAARALGATDAHIRVVAEIGRIAKRGAEREADAALGRALGDATQTSCSCSADQAAPAAGKREGACCSSEQAAPAAGKREGSCCSGEQAAPAAGACGCHK